MTPRAEMIRAKRIDDAAREAHALLQSIDTPRRLFLARSQHGYSVIGLKSIARSKSGRKEIGRFDQGVSLDALREEIEFAARSL